MSTTTLLEALLGAPSAFSQLPEEYKEIIKEHNPSTRFIEQLFYDVKKKGKLLETEQFDITIKIAKTISADAYTQFNWYKKATRMNAQTQEYQQLQKYFEHYDNNTTTCFAITQYYDKKNDEQKTKQGKETIDEGIRIAKKDKKTIYTYLQFMYAYEDALGERPYEIVGEELQQLHSQENIRKKLIEYETQLTGLPSTQGVVRYKSRYFSTEPLSKGREIEEF